MRVTRKNSKAGIEVSLKDHERRLAKEIGMSVNDKGVVVDPRITPHHALMRFFKYCGRDMPDVREAYREAFKTFRDDWLSSLSYGNKLYAHQKEALMYACHNRDFMLFFEQGLGKTITAISVPELVGARRTVIICPSLLKYQWMYDPSKDWGFDELDFSIIDRKNKHTVTAFNEKYLIINYEMIEKYWERITSSPIDCLIVDEAHRIKNHNTHKHRMVRDLREEAGRPRTLLLTGTPMTNRVNDLFAYYRLVGHPIAKGKNTIGGSYDVFLNRYAEEDGRKIVGVKNPQELAARMSNIMMRKRTEETLDLPPIIMRKDIIPLTEQSDTYSEVLSDMGEKKQRVKEIDELLKEAQGKEKQRLKQERKEILVGVRANIHTLNRMTAISKFDHIKGLVERLWEQGRKAVVFSPYTQPLTDLHEHFTNSGLIMGGMDAYQKERSKQDFVSGSDHVMLANVNAGGLGMNLTNARDVIFTALPFTPDQIEQPYKRVHRIGQDRTVNVHIVMCERSIDEHIYSIVKDKMGDINQVVDPGSGDRTYEDIEERILKMMDHATATPA